MTSAFELERALRQLKPEKHTRRLLVRELLPVVTDDVTSEAIGPVLLDTCVFIHNGRGQLPAGARRLIARHGATHVSAVTGMELAYAFGRLNPSDSRTRGALDYLREVLQRVPAHRLVDVSAADHTYAGVLTGILSRTQSLSQSERRKLLLDALIFASAQRRGLTVLTANVADFDLLHQLVPESKVACYRVSPTAGLEAR